MVVFLLEAVCIPGIRAQVVPTTSLAGVVRDSSGAIVPNSSLVLVNSATHLTRKDAADAQGRFLFTLLPAGEYELTAAAPGFSAYQQTGITLDVNKPATVNVRLSVAAVVQQVSVRANAEMVDTQSGSLREVVTERYIEELPLNGRNAASLVYMAPGAVNGVGQTPATYANQSSEALAISVNGTYGDQVAYKLDGATHQDSISGLNAVFPNPDALAEFSVQTNNFDARFGGVGGAVVNIVTKSGTNQLHGSVFDFLRNGDLNARNFFGSKRDTLKRNQFGSTVGGPIRRDQLFFFGSFQGTELRNTSFDNVAFVPSAAMRRGDFSGQKAIKNPQTGVNFPNNQIPENLLSPIAQNALSKVPTSSDPAGRLLYAVPQNSSKRQALGKMNYNTNRNMVTGSFFYDWFQDPGWNGDGTLLNYRLGQLQTTKEWNVSDTYTVAPHLINTAVFDVMVLNSHQVRTAPFSIFDFGDIKAAKPAPEFQETQISVTGFGGWGGGGPSPPGTWKRNNFELSDMISYVRSSHSLHTGVEFTPHATFDSSTGFQEEPILSFTGQASGSAMADFLLGSVNTFTQNAGKAKFTRGKQVRAYVQDDWRVTSRLTLNLGLRWDPYLPPTDPVHQQVSGYIAGQPSQRFPNAPAGLVFAGDPGFPAGGFDRNWGNFAPRAGFAWQALGGSQPVMVRGAFGMFYVDPLVRIYNNFVQNAPFSPTAQLFGVSLSDPYSSAGVTNPFPPFAPLPLGTDTKFALPVQFAFIDPHWTLGHMNSWNLTIERQFTANLLGRIAYVGDHGVHLQYTMERNPAIYGPGATLSNTNQRRPLYPNLASLMEMTNDGRSHYNALQATVEKRMSRQFSFVANYTFSKSLDNQSFDPQFQLMSANPFDPNFNYGRSDFDAPHNFSFWSVWDLPTFGGAPKLARVVLRGWSVNSILTWRSGTPFTISSGQDRSLTAVGLDRADLVGNPFLDPGRARDKVISQYFNTSAFALNAPGTFGTVGRNLLGNVRLFNLDFAMARSIPVNERLRLQLRGEFFNAFNNVHLNQPGTNFSATSTFGKINSSGEPRIVQLALKLVF